MSLTRFLQVGNNKGPKGQGDNFFCALARGLDLPWFSQMLNDRKSAIAFLGVASFQGDIQCTKLGLRCRWQVQDARVGLCLRCRRQLRPGGMLRLLQLNINSTVNCVSNARKWIYYINKLPGNTCIIAQVG